MEPGLIGAPSPRLQTQEVSQLRFALTWERVYIDLVIPLLPNSAY